MPHKKPLNPSIGSQATFTDREEPQRYFQEALAEIRQRKYSLLTFYGVGGIGKSCLLQHLKQAHLDKDDSSLYSCVDFAVPANREPHKTLRALVRNFTGKNRIPFAAFGLAYMIYWEKSFPDQDIKKAGLPFLEEGSLLATAVDAAELAGGLASLAIGTLNYLYNKSKQVSFDKTLRDALKQLQNLQSEQIEDQLPIFFAHDIEQYQRQHPDHNIVIFIDTHEALWQNKRTEANRLTQDQWLREIIAQLPRVLFVICGREKIIWDEDRDDNWGDYLQGRQHLLGRLSDPDARDFLKSCAINDPQIQDKIIADSEGVPYYLDLCVEIYQRIDTPTAADFANVGQHKLFERFTRYLDRAELETLKVLAHTRFYNTELFELLIEEFKSGYPISAMSQLNAFSFIRQEQEQFYIHELMRKSLLESMRQDNAERSNEITRFLFNYYDRQLQDLDIKNISEASLNALPEAFYYKAESAGAEELSDWFDQSYKTLIDAAHYKPLLETSLLLVQRLEDELGDEHLYTGYALHNLAYLHNSMANYQQADPLYQQS